MSDEIVDFWYSFLKERNSAWYYFSARESNPEIDKGTAMAEAVGNYFGVNPGRDAIAFLVAQKEKRKEQKKEEDYQEVSDGEVRLTSHLLEAGKSDNGAFNKKQCTALGVRWPLESGWYQRLIGKVVDKDDYEEFLSCTNDHLTSVADQELDISKGVIDYLRDLTSNTQKRINHLQQILEDGQLGGTEKQITEAKIALLKEFIPHFGRIQSQLTDLDSTG